MQILNIWLKKDGCKNNPIKSSTTKLGEHVSCGYSMFTICAIDRIKTKHDVHKVKYWMNMFFKSDDKIYRKVRDHCHYTGKYTEVLDITYYNLR